MSVRMRMTKSKTGSRRAHHGVKNLSHCNNVDGLCKSHRVSLDGKYKGRVVIDQSKREERIKRRKEEKKQKNQPKDETNVEQNEVIENKTNLDQELKV